MRLNINILENEEVSAICEQIIKVVEISRLRLRGKYFHPNNWEYFSRSQLGQVLFPNLYLTIYEFSAIFTNENEYQIRDVVCMGSMGSA